MRRRRHSCRGSRTFEPERRAPQCTFETDRRAPARTFGFVADVERLWRAGFAVGSSLENTVAIADGRILNTAGLRAPDEFVRHKILDAIGDLALAGAAMQGTFRSFRGGHALNHAALVALLARRDAWQLCDAGAIGRRVPELRTAIA